MFSFWQAIARFGRAGVLVAAVLGAGGCGVADLGRLDREVRANWSALLNADRLNVEFVDRLVAGQHVALMNQPRLRAELMSAAADVRRLREDRRLRRPLSALPADAKKFDRYAPAHRRLTAGLRLLHQSLVTRASAMRAWRSRGLTRESEWVLLRTEAAARAYNNSVRNYNRQIEGSFMFVSRALLFPGSGRFALLEDAGTDTAQRSRP